MFRHRATILGVLSLMVLAASVQAGDVFNMGGTRDPVTGIWTGLASLEFVTVGDPGNANDTRWTAPNRHGAVSYSYKIGTYEVTAGQYCAFLNAVAKTDTYGLYDPNMLSNSYGCKIRRSGGSGNYSYLVDANGDGIEDADRVNRPVNYISWGDAARFVNWLSNGQPSGSQGSQITEDGAYYINGAVSSAELMSVTKKSTAKYWIPTLDEWYKAAYYDPSKPGGAGYWLTAARSDSTPGRDLTEATNPGNNMNYLASSPYPIDSGTYYTTIVGEFQLSHSYYATWDQGGNVVEWTDTPYSSMPSENRVLHGGSFCSSPCNSGSGASYPASSGDYQTGFRVAMQVPEPGSSVLVFLGAFSLLAYAWQRRRRGP